LQPQNGYRLIFSLSSRVYYTRITPAVMLIYLSLSYLRNLLLKYSRSHPLQSLSCPCNSLLLHLTLGCFSPSIAEFYTPHCSVITYCRVLYHLSALCSPSLLSHNSHLVISWPPGVTESVTPCPWVLRNLHLYTAYHSLFFFMVAMEDFPYCWVLYNSQHYAACIFCTLYRYLGTWIIDLVLQGSSPSLGHYVTPHTLYSSLFSIIHSCQPFCQYRTPNFRAYICDTVYMCIVLRVPKWAQPFYSYYTHILCHSMDLAVLQSKHTGSETWQVADLFCWVADGLAIGRRSPFCGCAIGCPIGSSPKGLCIPFMGLPCPFPQPNYSSYMSNVSMADVTHEMESHDEVVWDFL
jgi:hypothetical protein